MSLLDQKFEELKKLYSQTLPRSLDRISGLLLALGSPQKRLPPVLHIAGTNGKGSTAAFLKSILQAAGYRVHVYSSPHLLQFNERLVLQGKMIQDDFLLEALQQCEKAFRAPLNWFELLTGAAFWAFSRVPADILILETGVGGTFDATNVIEKPLCSILTPISLDHQEILGPTLKEIAQAKAGIIKQGVPVVSAQQYPGALRVIQERAGATQSPLYVQNREWEVLKENQGVHFSFEGKSKVLPCPPLQGNHQIQNLGTALASLSILKDIFKISEAALIQGIHETQWPGRLQKLMEKPFKMWIDGAHNEAGAEALSQFIQGWDPQPTFIFGMLKTKDPERFLRPFKDKVEKVLTVPIQEEIQTYAAEDLLYVTQNLGFKAESYGNLSKALKNCDFARPALVTGSLRLVGEAMKVLSRSPTLCL